jgi:hypothetical protein
MSSGNSSTRTNALINFAKDPIGRRIDLSFSKKILSPSESKNARALISKDGRFSFSALEEVAGGDKDGRMDGEGDEIESVFGLGERINGGEILCSISFKVEDDNCCAGGKFTEESNLFNVVKTSITPANRMAKI